MRRHSHLLLLLVALCVGACGSEEPPDTVVVGRQRYLLNQSFDQTQARMEHIRCKDEARRALVLNSPDALVFHEVLQGDAVLRFGVGFGAKGPEPPTKFELSVLVVSEGDEEPEQLWSQVFERPPGTRWIWTDVEVPIRGRAQGDLHFRMTHAEGPAPGPDTVVPAWSEPVLESAGWEAEVESRNHRNVVVFLVDTLRADHLGCYGYERDTSPRLDQLANQGFVFQQARAVSSWTKPSIASIFTSRMPSQHGAEGYVHRMNGSERTVAQAFGDQGYRTAAIGYSEWVFNPEFNLNTGFQDLIYVQHGSVLEHTRADRVVDQAVAWLEQHQEEPFFLYVHTVDPHAPYTPPAEYDRFRDATETHDIVPHVLGPESFLRRTADQVSEEELAYLRALYDAEIAFTDAQLGRLIDRLQELRLWEETTLVVLSDHGEEFLDHGGWSHGATLYDEQLRVPWVLKAPASLGLDPAVVQPVVSLLDVAPTLCALAGIDPGPAPFLGQDLTGLLSGMPLDRESLLVSELAKQSHRALALRRGPIKYIVSTRPEAREEVYQLDQDPDEQHNLIQELEAAKLQPLRDTAAALQDLDQLEGVVLECLAGPEEVTVQVRISGLKGLADYNLLTPERFQDSVDWVVEGTTLRAELRLPPGDRDGLVLSLDPGQEANLEILLDGQQIPPQHLQVGPGERSAQTMPLVFTAGHEDLVGEPPAPGAAAPTRPRFRLFQRVRSSVDLSPDAAANLRAMGYAVGEDGD